MKKEEYNITLIAEFNKEDNSKLMLANLSNYLSSIVRKQDIILLDVQSYQKGYRLTCKINYYCYSKFKFIRGKYLKELANLSDWLLCDNDNIGSNLYKYHYTYT